MSWSGAVRLRSALVGAATGDAWSTHRTAGAGGDRSASPDPRPASPGRCADPVPGSVVRRVAGPALGSLVVVGLLAALVVIATGHPPASGAAAVSLGVLAIAAEADRRRLELPDQLLLLAALPVVFLVAVGVLTDRWLPLLMVVVGAVLAAAPVAVLHAASPAAMGFGDVKAALVLGAALGLVEPRLAPAAIALAALSAYVTARVTGRRRIALGPHLILAALAVAVVWTRSGPEVSPWR